MEFNQNSNGTDDPIEDQEVNNLLNEFNVDPVGEAPIVTPEKIGELNFEDFQKGLVEATGESVKSYQELQDLVKMKSDYENVLNERNRLAEESKMSPFENDFVKQINSLTKGNASMEEIQQFVNIQAMDIENLGDLEALKMQLKRELGSAYTPEEISALIEEQIEDFGDLEDEDNHRGRAKLKQAGALAKQELAKLKVETGEPESVKAHKLQQQAYTKQYTKWNTLNAQLLGTKETHSISYELPGGKTGNIDVPVEAEIMQEIVQQVSQAAAQAGLPFNKKTYDEVITPYANKLVWSAYGPQILQQALSSHINQAVDKTNQKLANVDPLDRGSQPAIPAKENDKYTAYKNKIYKQDGVGRG